MKYPTELLIMILSVVTFTFLFVCFSSPFSSGPGSSPPNLLTSETSAHIMSCADLQRELNRMDPTLKLEVDGICGPATQAAWDAVVFNGYALELWPE